MNSISFLDAALGALWRASWQASVIALLVLATHWICGRRLAPQWRYSLWLLVVIRLLLPATPQSPWSLFNLRPPSALPSANLEGRGLWAPRDRGQQDAAAVETSSGVEEIAPAPVPSAAPARPPVPPSPAIGGQSPALHIAALAWIRAHAGWIWFLGALALGMRLAWGNYLFTLQLRRRQPVNDPAVLQLLDECRIKLGLRSVPPLIEAPELDSPALFGCFRLKLLLPDGLLARFSADELRHVFLHELAHVRRRDPAMNWLTAVLLAIHWFNPVVWFAFHRMRADRELACDALALDRAQGSETRPYGRTVIKVLEGFTAPAAIPGLVGIIEDKQQFKQRINMIAQYKNAPANPLPALALTALLACVSLTDSKSDEPKPLAAESPARRLNERDAGNPRDRQLTLRKVTPDHAETWDHWVSFGDTRPSPDGRHFGYVNWNHGNLAVCDAQTGEVRDLTNDGTWSGTNQFTWGAVWAPDSQRIAFLWLQGDEGDLRIVDRVDGKPRVLVPQARDGSIAPFDWSRDGRFIVGLAPIRKWKEGEPRECRIVRVDADTGAVTVLKELPGSSDDVAMSLSPDGKYLVHDTKPHAKDPAAAPPSRLFVLRTDGSDDRLLLDHPASHSSPRWTPDGGHLVFRAKRSGEDALWITQMENGAASGEPRLLRDNFSGSRIMGFSNDGSFYFTVSTLRRNIYVSDVDFEAATIQPGRLVSLRRDGRNSNPRWSMDGSRLAYLSSSASGGASSAALVFQDAATGKERDVEVPALNFFSTPFWSPDLSKVAGAAKIPGGDNDSRALYLVDGKTGERSMFLRYDAASANHTRDGRHLIYLRHIWKGADSASALVERELASGVERILVQTQQTLGFTSQVVLSHDDAKLAHCHKPYSPSEETTTTLYITRRADGAMKPMWEAPPGESTVLDWLPDHRHALLSVNDKQGAQQLYLVDTETGTARPFGSALRGNDKLQQVSVHPSGKRIAVSRGGVIREIWAMKNLVAPERIAAK